jgi:intraflagellar transport protein 81
VTGIRATKEDLEKISAAKSELDELKGKTLDDMSTMVKELNETIATKKTLLAPLIKDLRARRTEVHELETVYNEKKSAYDQLARTLEAQHSRLELEVKSLREKVWSVCFVEF